MIESKPLDLESVERYLESKCGDALLDVQKAMMKLTGAFEPVELAEGGFGLYEQFRLQIPEGVVGWSSNGELDLELIRKLQ